jgi:hypothetical protein
MARFLAETSQSGFSLACQSGPRVAGKNGSSFYGTHVRLSASQVSTRESSDMIILAGELAEYFCEKHSLRTRQMVGVEFSIEPFCVRVYKRQQYLAPR